MSLWSDLKVRSKKVAIKVLVALKYGGVVGLFVIITICQNNLFFMFLIYTTKHGSTSFSFLWRWVVFFLGVMQRIIRCATLKMSNYFTKARVEKQPKIYLHMYPIKLIINSGENVIITNCKIHLLIHLLHVSYRYHQYWYGAIHLKFAQITCDYTTLRHSVSYHLQDILRWISFHI